MKKRKEEELVDRFEKQWWQSKKFVAFLILEMLFAGLIAAVALLSEQFGWPLASVVLGIVMTMGVIGLTYMGKQAAVDKYVRAMSLGQAPE